MARSIEFTEEAKARIDVAKSVMDATQWACDRESEDWHAFTFKEDKKNPDPVRFKIHRTKKTMIGVMPKKHLFNITVFDKDKTVVMDNFCDDLCGLTGIDLSNTAELADWKIKIYA